MRLVVAARNNRLMLFYEYLGFLDTEFYFILSCPFYFFPFEIQSDIACRLIAELFEYTLWL